MAFPQPDFPLVSQRLAEISDHVSRCVNLPAIAGGQQLNARLDQIQATLEVMHQDTQLLTQAVAALQTRIATACVINCPLL